jgi:hypothetical protein
MLNKLKIEENKKKFSALNKFEIEKKKYFFAINKF